jgi:hypothetical protein
VWRTATSPRRVTTDLDEYNEGMSKNVFEKLFIPAAGQFCWL